MGSIPAGGAMQPQILYEDEYILALDKPSGLMVHGDGRSKEPTLVDWINKNYPELKDVGEEQVLQNGEKISRPGIVHRLDKETSGVIVLAKTKEAHRFLKEQFQNKKIEKIYNAVAWGNFKEKEGVIEKSIGRSVSGKWAAFNVKNKTREAVTEYKILGQNKDLAYLEVRPKTGRTHQIRVHLKSIGRPVVGDKLYGHNPSGPPYLKGGIGNYDRLMLHAVSIKLELPNHTHIKIESPLPEEFENFKNLLKEA